MTKKTLTEAITAGKPRSAWSKGVRRYAIELIEYVEMADFEGSDSLRKKVLLNGAENWRHYSEAGCALIYNSDIAERLCAPWEIKRTKNGKLNPNSRETWFDIQARALYQAASLILRAAR